MDVETSEAIETLRADLRRVETTLSARMDLLAGGLDATGSSLRAEMRQILAEMGDMREEVTRHADVLFETLRDDIRMIAEGLVALDGKVESLRRPTGLQ